VRREHVLDRQLAVPDAHVGDFEIHVIGVGLKSTRTSADSTTPE